MTTPTPPGPRHRVVIVGCGFGGLFAARRLRRRNVDVTVIDRTNHHLFQPLLYQVATGILSEGDIAPPIRDILRKQRNTRVLLGDVTGIDAAARTVAVNTLGDRTEISYDSLILAGGASQSYFGNDEFVNYAPGMKTIDDALELRGRIFGAFEMAEHTTDPVVRQAWLTFTVVGAGPTGVEMAGQIAELSHRSLNRNFRTINPRDARVILLDAGPRLLATFPETLQHKAAATLSRLGVEVQLGVAVIGIDAGGVSTNSQQQGVARIESATKVWAAGVQASSLGRMLADTSGIELDRAGRVEVTPDCSVPGHSEIFVVGDLMSLSDLPGVAEVAMQAGAHAADTIARQLNSKPAKEFKYHDLGSMATISRFNAVATIGPLNVGGFVGWLMWLFVHLMFLTGFKSRIAVLANWTVAFVGRARPQRTITRQQIQDRQAQPLRRRDSSAVDAPPT